LEELNEDCFGGGLFNPESLYQTINELDKNSRAKYSYP